MRVLEPAIRALQLVGHVLERHELHAERRDEEQDRDREEGLCPFLGGPGKGQGRPQVDARERQQGRADD